MDADPAVIDAVTAVSFALVFIVAVYLNFKIYRIKFLVFLYWIYVFDYYNRYVANFFF